MSQSKAYTWFEAQTICREKNQSLTLWKNESASFYWIGFYKKRSQWIKIIGDADSIYESWEKKKKYCKDFGGYPIGNLALSNATIACKESMHKDGSPIWVGIVRDYYQKEEQGQLNSKSGQILIEKCMKCRSSNSIQGSECQYEPCNDTLDTVVYCSKKKDSTTPLPVNTDTSYSETKTRISSTSVTETTSIVSIDLEITKSKEESSDVIVPVIIVTLVLFLCAVAIILYIRRKKQRKEKDTNEVLFDRRKKQRKEKDTNGGQNYPTVEFTNSSNVENNTDNNYIVLQKSNPSYELAGECVVGCVSPYNEAEDGTYDHLGNKDARKTPAEDIYNHTSGAELSDLSDYDVTNHKRLNKEENTYDHAGVGNSSYGHFDLHEIKETDYSVLS